MNDVSCNLCGFDDTTLVQKAEEPFCVVQCKNCGLVYTNPIPVFQFLEEHYNEEYYRDWIHKQSKNRERMWETRLRELKEFKQSGRLLDVGCGLETFLKLAQQDGFEVQGTEVSEFVSKQGNHKYNIPVFKGELKAARFPSAYFDVITAWHSLEHMPDPKGNLIEAHRILKNDGILVVAVPNLNNYMMRFFYLLVKRKKFALFSPIAKELHLYHFSVPTLTKMLNKAGFEISKVELDLSAVVFQRKIIDLISVGVHLLTGKNYADAFKIYARKISEVQDEIMNPLERDLDS